MDTPNLSLSSPNACQRKSCPHLAVELCWLAVCSLQQRTGVLQGWCQMAVLHMLAGRAPMGRAPMGRGLHRGLHVCTGGRSWHTAV